MPLSSTIKNKLNSNISVVFEKFKDGRDMLTYDAFFNMVTFFLAYELHEDERSSLSSFLDAYGRQKDSRFVSGSLTREMFEQLCIVDRRRQVTVPNQSEAKATLTKVKSLLRLKQMQIVSEIEGTYQTPQERIHKEINARSLKHFLFKCASLTPYEMENLVRYLDKDQDGFVKVVDI